MATTTLHIRNMVCNRCILVVRQLLEGLGLTPLHIELGKAIVQEELPPEAKAALNTALEAVGFELCICKIFAVKDNMGKVIKIVGVIEKAL